MSKKTLQKRSEQKPAQGTQEVQVRENPDFDAVQVATDQVDQAIGDRKVPAAKRDLAIWRHTVAVRKAGDAVDLDWTTQQFIADRLR